MKLCGQCKKYGKCGKPYTSMSNYAEKCKDFEDIETSDKKITDSEIVKALDICSKSTNGCSHSNYTCEDCYLNGQPMCSSVLLQDTIDFFNRLQAENESITEKFKCRQTVYAEFSKIIQDKNAEIIRLSSILKKKGRELTRKRKRCDELVEEKIRLQKEIKTVIECKFESVSQSAKAEAYQEIVNKIKIHAYYIDFPKEHRVVDEDDIDNLLKELAGDSNAKEKQ